MATGLVSLMSRDIVFQFFCSRGNFLVFLSPTFLPDKQDSSSSSSFPLPEGEAWPQGGEWVRTITGSSGQCFADSMPGTGRTRNKRHLSSEQSDGDFLVPVAA